MNKDKGGKKVVDAKPQKSQKQAQKSNRTTEADQNQTAVIPDTESQKLIEKKEESQAPIEKLQALMVPDAQPQKVEESTPSEQPLDLDKDFKEALKNL